MTQGGLIDPPNEPAAAGLNVADVTDPEADASQAQLSAKVALPVFQGRGISPAILATLAVVYTLYWAQTFFIALLVGILISYTLNPLVVWLERFRVPRALGSAFVMLALLGGMGATGYALRGEAQAIVNQLPTVVNRISREISYLSADSGTNLQSVQKAATAMQKATLAMAGASQRGNRVVVDAPPFQVGNFLWVSSLGLFAFGGQAAMVLFLVYFMLLSGDTFKRKLVRLSGPTLSSRKITVHILDDINASIQRYMLMLLVTNVLLGLLSWLAFHWIGLANPGAWGVGAGLLHIVPYFGPLLTALVTGVAAFMQFNSLWMALLVAGTSLLIATLVGIFVTTWMIGRIAKMNTAAVFISLLFWTWLWGIWGILLSVPIIVIIKVVAQHIEQLHGVAELLTD